jgi:hypothetical protein
MNKFNIYPPNNNQSTSVFSAVYTGIFDQKIPFFESRRVKKKGERKNERMCALR